MQVEFFQEKTIEIAKDQTILEAALDAGIPHFHACGGKAKCSTFRVLVREGADQLAKPNRREARLTSVLRLPNTVRLACQTKVKGEPVKLERMIKAESEVSAFLKLDEQRPGQFKLRPLGEEKHLVLFFLDIRNFTPFVEMYLPFDVIYLVRKLFDIFHRVITENKGEILETAGDSVYAIFGYETAIKDAADSAITAGFKILHELDALNKTYGKLFLKEFHVGIGIHSGKVIVGELNYGGGSRRSAMGRAVNIASRIQSSTKVLNNSFIVSDEVFRLSGYSGPSKADDIKVAGVKDLIKVHAIGEPYK